jgi:hypothetical protein
MTDAFDQALSTEQAFSIDTVPTASDVSPTVRDTGTIGIHAEVNFEDGGDLARSTDILGRLSVDLELAGLAGELRTAKIIYLAVTSRLFPWPLSVAHKGPSSAGKSFTIERALQFFPREAYFARTGMSERGLIYSSEAST